MEDTIINVDEQPRTALTVKKARILQDYLDIVPDDEIDEMFLLVLNFMKDHDYRLKDTPEALLKMLCE